MEETSFILIAMKIKKASIDRLVFFYEIISVGKLSGENRKVDSEDFYNTLFCRSLFILSSVGLKKTRYAITRIPNSRNFGHKNRIKNAAPSKIAQRMMEAVW